MPRPYSMDLRERAVAAYKRGRRTLEEVAAEFSVSEKTLSHWLKLEAETGSLDRGAGATSRPSKKKSWKRSSTRYACGPMPRYRSTSKRWSLAPMSTPVARQ